MPDLPAVFERGSRCVMAFSGRRGPVVSPMAFWADGASLWMSTPAVSVKAGALRRRPEVSVYVEPTDGSTVGAVVTGRARLYGLHDPLRLAVHGAVISTAMTALAARNTGTILGYVQDARSVPARFRPRNRVAVRIAVDRVRNVPVPTPGPGIAPALPAMIAPGVRRAVAGRRVVTLAVEQPDGQVVVRPVIWGAGFQLDLPDELSDVSGAPAVVHLGSDPRNRPTAVAGLSLFGEVDNATLKPIRATWWEGFDLTTVDLPATPPSITLPD